ncbi:ribosomal RNA-processing 7 homolog A [Pelobates cultripes]|uniref:Ribosomal RNA-processing 7 homolog A n=1 Tax=Pelobates cultripes TaxID=61616 RepID=A0AAD1SUM8_PELCU|nr:ribosomal RNA-processing 7 homolog A [Pelobates cultripes]CAH2312173.1 ribosomal RNA-processing 7 homolog A [Pelobates cultripes]
MSKMAASIKETTFAAPAGYIAIPVKFSEERRAYHCLYAKEHKVRDQLDKTHPLNRTLFVINVPPYCTEKCLSQIFSSCGTVNSVELQENPGPSEKKHTQSRYFDRKIPKGFKVAYVVYKNQIGLRELKLLNFKKPYVLSGNLRTVKTGIHKWIEDYESSLTDITDLQTEIDDFMKEYDKRMEEEEKKAEEEEGVPDEDGWVKVTRKGRRPGLARTEAVNLRVMEMEKKKRAQKELLNFYAWQHRDGKREHLAELRKKFEEDKQKIALMRAQRKFRPY